MTARLLLVTGGSAGIGAATARLAAAGGWDVAVHYASDRAAAEAVAAEVRAAGRRAGVFGADLTQPGAVPALFAAVDREMGQLGGLVNSAGRTGRISPVETADPAEIRTTIDLNVTTLILCTQEAIRRLSRKAGGQGGPIVNLSSAAATLGSSGEFVWYAASKAAVDAFTEGVAREVANDGIRVNAVSPGLMLTEIHAKAGSAARVERLTPRIPMKRPGTAEEAAQAVLWLLSDAASYVTGANIRVAGGR